MKNQYGLWLALAAAVVLMAAACSMGGAASSGLSQTSENANTFDQNDNEKNNPASFRVVIDPGHGGKDVGATGVSGQFEKNFNLLVAEKVRNRLDEEPHIQVFMTRTDDRFISQKSRYRPQYANKQKADVFISIHGNTYSDPNVSGTETYYYHENSQLFAQIIQKHVVQATGFRDRGIKKKDLFVVKDTEMPAALIEVGYLSNPRDESLMWSDDFQNEVADSIVRAIKEYKEKLENQGISNYFSAWKSDRKKPASNRLLFLSG